MTCGCGTKMKCTFTVPIDRSRYRTYKCPNCGGVEETIEVPRASISSPGAKEVLVKGQQKKFQFFKRRG